MTGGQEKLASRPVAQREPRPAAAAGSLRAALNPRPNPLSVRGQVRLFNLMAPDAEPVVMEGSPGSVRNALFLGNDQLVVAASNDGFGFRVWDTRSRKMERTIDTAAPVTDIEASADGRFLATAAGTAVQIWDASSFDLLRTFTLATPVWARGRGNVAVFLFFGRVARRQQAAACAAARSAARAEVVRPGGLAQVESVSVCAFRSRFAAGGADMWPRLYDWNTGEELGARPGAAPPMVADSGSHP